jgi:hypothetical protein
MNPSCYLTNSLIHQPNKLIDLFTILRVTSRQGPRRKHCFSVAVQFMPWKHSFAELLLSNGCCTVAYFAVVAKQRVFMPQYDCRNEKFLGSGTGLWGCYSWFAFGTSMFRVSTCNSLFRTRFCCCFTQSLLENSHSVTDIIEMWGEGEHHLPGRWRVIQNSISRFEKQKF